MLGSITPLGERGHDRRWRSTAAWYVAGSAVGGTVIGLLAGLLGAALAAVGLGPSAPVVLALLAALCLLGAALDLRLGGLRLPSVHRQVNEDWLARYRGWVVGAGFGVQLGLGVVTIVTTATVYLTLAAALLSGSAVAGAALGLLFGVLRAVPLLTTARVSTLSRLRAVHARITRWEPAAHRAALLTQALLAAVAGVGGLLLVTG